MARGQTHSVPTLRQFRNNYIRAKPRHSCLRHGKLSQSVGLSRVPSQRRLERPSRTTEQGRPLIASLQPGRAKNPVHYVVVTGIDWQNGAVFINDPARGNSFRVAREDFRKKGNGGQTALDLLALPEKGFVILLSHGVCAGTARARQDIPLSSSSSRGRARLMQVLGKKPRNWRESRRHREIDFLAGARPGSFEKCQARVR